MKSAYGRQTPPPDYELTCVEPGSPMNTVRDAAASHPITTHAWNTAVFSAE